MTRATTLTPRLAEGDSLKRSDVWDSLRVDYEDAFQRLGLEAVVGHQPGNVVRPRALIPAQKLVAGASFSGAATQLRTPRSRPWARMAYTSRKPGAGPRPSGCSAASKADQWRRCSGASARHRRTSPSSPYGLRPSSRRRSTRANSARESEVLWTSLRNHWTVVALSMRRLTRTSVAPHDQPSIWQVRSSARICRALILPVGKWLSGRSDGAAEYLARVWWARDPAGGMPGWLLCPSY